MATHELLDEMRVSGDLEAGLTGVVKLSDETIGVFGMSSGQDKRLLRFSLDPRPLIDLGLNRITRGFTEVECATYGIDPCPTTVEAVQAQYGQ